MTTDTRRRLWAMIALVAVALNLRAPIAAVSAMVLPLSTDLRLPGWSVSVLATLPTLCLGLFAFAGPRLRSRVGDERLVLGCVVAIAAGDGIRMLADTPALFLGTTLVAAGIGVANVTIPGLIKRDFPDRFTTITGLYAATMTLGAAGAAAAAQELVAASGAVWAWPLALVCVPIALVALVVWLPAALTRSRGDADPAPGASVWRHPMAWAVTAFFGTTTLLAYFVLGWLPTLVADRGVVATGGLVLAASSLAQVVGAAAGPAVVRRLRDLRPLGVAVAALTAAGLIGVTLAPAPALVWASGVLLGLAQGTAFNLALSLIGLRSPDPGTTTALSAMAQGTGYLVGIAGPLGAGLLHDASGGWGVPVAALVVVAAAQAVAGLAAGRAPLVDATRPGAPQDARPAVTAS